MTDLNVVVKLEASPAIVAALDRLGGALVAFLEHCRASLDGVVPVIPPPPAAAGVLHMREPVQSAAAPLRPGRRLSVWFPERDALLRRLRKDRFSFEAVLVKLNDLDGPKIHSVDAARSRYRDLVQSGYIPRSEMLGRGNHAPRGIEEFDDAKGDSGAPVKPETSESAAQPPELPVAVPQPTPQPMTESVFGAALRSALAEKETAARSPARFPSKQSRPAPVGRAAPDMRPVEVSIEQVRQWAGERGLAQANGNLDIAAINRKRCQLGVPEFIIKPAAAGSRVSA